MPSSSVADSVHHDSNHGGGTLTRSGTLRSHSSSTSYASSIQTTALRTSLDVLLADAGPDTRSCDPEVPEIAMGALQYGASIPYEYFWRHQHDNLSRQGFKLRDRYKPDWRQSWHRMHERRERYEDGIVAKHPNVIDAVRVRGKTQTKVVLKKVKKADYERVKEIYDVVLKSRHFGTKRNHCVEILETIPVAKDSESLLLVMPLLRRFDSPPFEQVDEVIDFCGQVIEGLHFMHTHGVAYGAPMCGNNIMMDASKLYPESYHPQAIDLSTDCKSPAEHLARSNCKPRYFFGDLLRATLHSPPAQTKEGGAIEIDEMKELKAKEAFSLDIYNLGEMLARDIVLRYRGVDFLIPFLEKLMDKESSLRPDVEEVLLDFQNLRSGITQWHMLSRVSPVNENAARRTLRGLKHVIKATREYTKHRRSASKASSDTSTDSD